MYGRRHSIYRKDTVKASCLDLRLLLFGLSALLDHILHIQQLAHAVSLCALLRLLCKVVDDVSGDDADALGMMQRLVLVDAPYLFALHIALHLHRALIVHMEAQHILIPDGIDDRIGMQGARRFTLIVGFASKQLSRRRVLAAFMRIDRKDRCTSEAKHQILLESFGNILAHIPELTSVTLVEYQHDVLFLQHLAQFLVVVIELGFHQVRQLLDCRDDDVTVVTLQLT